MAKNGALGERLRRLMQEGNLTGADLARLLDRPDPTVREWIKGRYNPAGGPVDSAYVEAQIKRLEGLLKRKHLLPVPRLRQDQHIAYVIDMKGELGKC